MTKGGYFVLSESINPIIRNVLKVVVKSSAISKEKTFILCGPFKHPDVKKSCFYPFSAKNTQKKTNILIYLVNLAGYGFSKN